MKKPLLVLLVILMLGGQAKATLPVIDYSSIAHNIYSQAVNYIQYLEHTANQLTQITNQVTQISNQVTALTRFGNPNYYVNLLHLDQFMSSASTLTGGVGNTIAQYRQAANRVMALRYTADGLYQNFEGTVDRWGNTVRYAPDSFRKFSAVNNMYDSYNTDLRTYNNTNASLQQQLTTATQNLNAASTQMESDKYHAEINAIHSQMSALGTQTVLSGQRILVQQAANQNDAARVQEAQAQQKEQERKSDLQNLAHAMSSWISGGTN